jgi:hypothetical protein
MPAIPQVTQTGPRTYSPGLGITVLAGQLVEAFADGVRGGRIRPAGAGSARVLGVALQDAIAPEDLVTSGTTVNGRHVLNMNVLPQNTAVAYDGVETTVTYSAAAAFGDRLVATANGQVAPAIATSDPRTIVGICTAPAGMTAPGVGLARIL